MRTAAFLRLYFGNDRRTYILGGDWMLSIIMPRGDIRLIRFQVNDPQTRERSQVDFDEIYMTVKENVYERNYIFQKRISNGGIEKLGVGDYQIRLDASDTDPLDFNKIYPFDIELVYEDEIKQTEYGELKITPEVTCEWNEVE